MELRKRIRSDCGGRNEREKVVRKRERKVREGDGRGEWPKGIKRKLERKKNDKKIRGKMRKRNRAR